MNFGVVIVSAGIGVRLGKLDKPILKIGAKPLFLHSLEVFKGLKQVKQIVLVLRKSHFSLAKRVIQDRRVLLVEGGRKRNDSVCNGLLALREDIDSVLIHDGARPFISKKSVLKLIRALKIHPAVILGAKITDTLKLVKGKNIKQTVKRDDFYQAQTPQGFRKDLIVKAYGKLKSKVVTDDAQAVELLGETVKIIEGDGYNIKITYPQDIVLAEVLLGRGSYCIGLGFDVHKFSRKKKSLILGGVKIPAPFSLEAVSDGDLILHAVCDAILGAVGHGDIGDYFPPESKQSKNISSQEITRCVFKKISGEYRIENIDIVIVADKPRLVKHKQAIIKSLKKILSVVNVNLKIKSKEGQDILGTKGGMSCLVVALLKKK